MKISILLSILSLPSLTFAAVFTFPKFTGNYAIVSCSETENRVPTAAANFCDPAYTRLTMTAEPNASFKFQIAKENTEPELMAFINAYHHETADAIENARFTNSYNRTNWQYYRVDRLSRFLFNMEVFEFSYDAEGHTILVHGTYEGQASPPLERRQTYVLKTVPQ